MGETGQYILKFPDINYEKFHVVSMNMWDILKKKLSKHIIFDIL